MKRRTERVCIKKSLELDVGAVKFRWCASVDDAVVAVSQECEVLESQLERVEEQRPRKVGREGG